METIRVRGGRTGRKIHLGTRGSSQTVCGAWLKTNVERYKVADSTPVTCDSCTAMMPKAAGR